MMYRYKFFCKKCGHYLELETKGDWLSEKHRHKTEGCDLEFAPHLNDYILCRRPLAMEARRGRSKLKAMEAFETVLQAGAHLPGKTE